jgi:hypothetical protein
MNMRKTSNSSVKCFFIALVSFIFSETLFAQEQLKKECFETEINTENVFTKIQIIPSFIGGSNTFKCYLNSSSWLSILANELLIKDSVYYDTARVRFVISKYGVMSNLSVTKCLSESYRKEVYRIMKGSSCGWIPGNFSGRNINGWVEMDLFFHLKRYKDSSVQETLSFKQYDYKTDE